MLSQKKRLIDLYSDHFGKSPEKITQLKGDGSDRSIYRLQYSGETVIGISGENPAENLAFVQFSNHFANCDLPVPKIYTTHLADGIYLEEDLGSETLFDRISKEKKKSSDTVLNLYRKVIEWLPKFQIVAAKDLDFSFCYQYREFSRDAMLWDLQYFRHRFLDIFYDGEFGEADLLNDFRFFTDYLSHADSDFFLYRDFQSRNIMLKNDRPYFIDYQSGRRGALQYDLASLLYDAKARLPENIREELIDFYLECVQKYAQIDSAKFMQYFYGFVLIRILQALGAFGFLSKVKGKTQFNAGIPLALANIASVMDKVTVLKRMPALKTILDQLTKEQNEKRFADTHS
ncbi:MAG: phosphotransferase [Calditrichaeota bacterium]|nr:phosphotransferase [Calditrichota bacterium]